MCGFALFVLTIAAAATIGGSGLSTSDEYVVMVLFVAVASSTVAAPVILKMVAESGSGKVLGVQAVGPGNVAKEVAVGATAIQAGMTVQDMLNLDLPYAPPFSPVWDPLHIAASECLKRL